MGHALPITLQALQPVDVSMEGTTNKVYALVTSRGDAAIKPQLRDQHRQPISYSDD